MKKSPILMLAAMFCLFCSCDKLKSLGNGSGDFHSNFTISSITPLEGAPGTIITIRGNGFSKDSLKNVVFANTTKARIITSSDTVLQAIIPETNTASANVKIFVNNIPSNQPFSFHYADVYVTGAVYNANRSFARLWKNGIVQSYPDTSFTTATRLFADGGNIYFGTNNGYFKNSSYVKLNPNPSNPAIVNSVVVNKGNIFAAWMGGYFENTVFYKIGYTYYPIINDIVFNNDSMFMAAYDPEYGRGILYKNGKMQPLDRGDRHADGEVVAIHAQDVHVGGYNVELSSNAAEWINGKVNSITGYSFVNDIYFSGDDEYLAVAGFMNQVLYLKNGVPTMPLPKNTNFSGSSITLNAGSIYVAGNLSYSSSPGYPYIPTSQALPTYQAEAVYFKDGIKNILPRSTYKGALANSILVVER